MKKTIFLLLIIIATYVAVVFVFNFENMPLAAGDIDRFSSKELADCLVVSNKADDTIGEIICNDFKFYFEIGNHVQDPSSNGATQVEIDTLDGDYRRMIIYDRSASSIQLFLERLNHPFSTDSLEYRYALSLTSLNCDAENFNRVREILKSVEPDF